MKLHNPPKTLPDGTIEPAHACGACGYDQMAILERYSLSRSRIIDKVSGLMVCSRKVGRHPPVLEDVEDLTTIERFGFSKTDFTE